MGRSIQLRSPSRTHSCPTVRQKARTSWKDKVRNESALSK
jgi:hypothetical protein